MHTSESLSLCQAVISYDSHCWYAEYKQLSLSTQYTQTVRQWWGAFGTSLTVTLIVSVEHCSSLPRSQTPTSQQWWPSLNKLASYPGSLVLPPWCMESLSHSETKKHCYSTSQWTLNISVIICYYCLTVRMYTQLQFFCYNYCI